MTSDITHCEGTFCEMRNECSRYKAHLRHCKDYANNYQYIDPSVCQQYNYDWYYPTNDRQTKNTNP